MKNFDVDVLCVYQIFEYSKLHNPTSETALEIEYVRSETEKSGNWRQSVTRDPVVVVLKLVWNSWRIFKVHFYLPLTFPTKNKFFVQNHIQPTFISELNHFEHHRKLFRIQ